MIVIMYGPELYELNLFEIFLEFNFVYHSLFGMVS